MGSESSENSVDVESMVIESSCDEAESQIDKSSNGQKSSSEQNLSTKSAKRRLRRGRKSRRTGISRPDVLRLGNLPPHFTTETVEDMIHKVTGFARETHLYYIETYIRPECSSIDALVKFSDRSNLIKAFKKFIKLQKKHQGSPTAVTLLYSQSPEYLAQAGFETRYEQYMLSMNEWHRSRKRKKKSERKKAPNETQQTGNDQTEDNQTLNDEIPTESFRRLSSKSCSSPEPHVEKITAESNDNINSFDSMEEAVIKKDSAEFIDAQTEDSNDSMRTVVLTPIKLEQSNYNEDRLEEEHESNTNNTTVVKQESIENVTNVVKANASSNLHATVVKQEQTDICDNHHQTVVEDAENIIFLENVVKREPKDMCVGSPLVIFDDPVDKSICGNSLATVVKLEPTELSNDYPQDVTRDSANTNASCNVLKNVIRPEPMNHNNVPPRVIGEDSVTLNANSSTIEAVVKREPIDLYETPPSVVIAGPENSATFNTKSSTTEALVKQELINLCESPPPVLIEEPNNSVMVYKNCNTKGTVVKQEPIDLCDTPPPDLIEEPKSSVTLNTNGKTMETVVKQEPIDLCDTPPPVVIEEPKDTGCSSPAIVVNNVTNCRELPSLDTAASEIDEILDNFDPSVLGMNEEPETQKKRRKRLRRSIHLRRFTNVHVTKLPCTTTENSKRLIKYELLKKINKQVDKNDDTVYILENETGNNPFGQALIKLETHLEAALVCNLLNGSKVANNVIEAKLDIGNRVSNKYQIYNTLNPSKRKNENTDVDAHAPSAKQAKEINKTTSLYNCCDPKLLPTEENCYGFSPAFLSKIGACMPLSSAIIVENLHDVVDLAKLHEVFSLAGEVRHIQIQIHKENKERKARVEFDHPVEAVQALHMFEKQKLYDKPLVMQMEPALCKRPLPIGLSGVNRGLGKNGESLKAVRTVMELRTVHEILYELKKMNKFESNDISSVPPFNVWFSKRNIQNGVSNISNATKTIPSTIKVTPVQSLDIVTSLERSAEPGPPSTSEETPQKTDVITNKLDDSQAIEALGTLLKTRGMIPTHTECKNVVNILAALQTNSNDNSCNMLNMNPITNAADAFRNNFYTTANSTCMTNKPHPTSMPNYGGIPHPKMASNPMRTPNSTMAPNPKGKPKPMIAPTPIISPNRPSLLPTPKPSPPTTKPPPLTKPAKAQSQEKKREGYSRDPRLKTLPDDNRLMDGQEEDEITKVIFQNLPASVTQTALAQKMDEVGGSLGCVVTGGGGAVATFRSLRYADRCIRLFHLSKVDGQIIEVICI